MTPTRCRRRKRPGIATLEFVLVWPLLLMMVAGIFLMARAGVSKEAAVTSARDRAWAERPRAQPGEILRNAHDPMGSRVSGGRPVNVAPGPLFRQGLFEAESFVFVIGRFWNFRDVPFDALGDFRIHETPLGQIAANLPGVGPLMAKLPAALAWGLGPAIDPVLIAASAAGAVLNPLVRAAGILLKTIGNAVFAPVRLVVAVLRAAARATLSFGLARRLGRVLDLLDLVGRSFDNLERASRGLPVENPSGLGSLRQP